MDKLISLGLLAALALPVYGQKKEEERVENASAVAAGRAATEEIGHVL